MYVSLDSKIRVSELNEISKEKAYRFIVRLSDDLGYAEDVTVILQKYHSSAKEEFPLKYTNSKNGMSTFISDFIHFNFGTGLYFYCFKVTLNRKIYNSQLLTTHSWFQNGQKAQSCFISWSTDLLATRVSQFLKCHAEPFTRTGTTFPTGCQTKEVKLQTPTFSAVT